MTRLKRIFILFIFLFGCLSASRAIAQMDDIYSMFRKFNDLYGSGDFVEAERCMLTVLDSDIKLPDRYIAAACNNLGLIKMKLGLYTEALDYFNKSENLTPNIKENYKELASIYNNKSRIYTYRRLYSTAIEFLEKAIRLFQNLENLDRSVLLSLSTAYLNLGIIYYEMRDYASALENLVKSASLKLNNHLPEIELTFLNLAKAYAQTGNLNLAEEYFTRSINKMNEKFGEDYYRSAEVYFDYGLFLRSAGRNAEAFEIHRKALSICRKNYGEKHSLVALSLKHLGDDYLAQADFRSALEYYQKSLIAVVNDFDNMDIFSNPQIDSSLFDIRLLDNLKSKARALELYANEQNDKTLKLNTITKSLETIELALHLIDNIRNNYFTEDSRIYLSENEKETYLFAVHMASTLYTLTGDIKVKEKIYSISQKAKSAVLQNEITENNLLYSAAVHDTTIAKQNRLTGSIAAYNNLIIEESRKTSPDSTRISLWKDALFDMNREKERITDKINKEFPQYRELILKTEPVSLTMIQRHLHRDETVVDYLLSNQYNNGTRNLYTFLITRNDFEFYETRLDSLFFKNAEIIRNTDQLSANSKFRDHTDALSYMYENLVKPMERDFAGKKLIIIPDEEIAWLPFDAFLMSGPEPYQTDYERLRYLIYNYTVSYGYSSSLIFSKGLQTPRVEEVLSFTPDYSDDNRSGMAFNELNGAVIEIGSIYKWFRGKGFTGNQATETNFRQALNRPAVFHMAMHSVSDTTDSRFSYMMFDTHNDTLEDGKLYNYEISLIRIQSPMVVLSACNSGTGTMYHSEGLMSLARGFILAGASSVIRTKWEVNDEVSATIITQFYYNLSKGKHKNEAMRLAKLWYLKTSSPAYSSPYFWAAYEVLGDHAPITRHIGAPGLIIITAGVIIIAVFLIFYFRRRKIFTERSL